MADVENATEQFNDAVVAAESTRQAAIADATATYKVNRAAQLVTFFAAQAAALASFDAAKPNPSQALSDALNALENAPDGRDLADTLGAAITAADAAYQNAVAALRVTYGIHSKI